MSRLVRPGRGPRDSVSAKGQYSSPAMPWAAVKGSNVAAGSGTNDETALARFRVRGSRASLGPMNRTFPSACCRRLDVATRVQCRFMQGRYRACYGRMSTQSHHQEQ